MPFMLLNTSLQPLLALKVSFGKSADSLMGTPLVCASLGSTSLGLFELPGLPGSLFPLPDWESSPSLCFQISFPFLAVMLLLLAPL